MNTLSAQALRNATPDLFPIWRAVVAQELKKAFRRKEDSLSAVFFFVVVTSLFPLGIGPDTNLLAAIGPSVVWVAALLSMLLSLHRLFQDDQQDGSLDSLFTSPLPLGFSIHAKATAHWLKTGFLLSLVSPVIALQFGLTTGQAGLLMASLLLGTPILSLLGAVGAALTLGSRGGGLLLSLLLLPLLTPVLIFGSGAVTAETSGSSGSGHFFVIGALLSLALFFAPWAAAVSLRIAAD